MLAILAVAAACAIGPGPGALLEANRAASQPEAPSQGTMTSRYAYAGGGMTGVITTAVDLATGRFVDEERIGPISEASGFDGRGAWARDLSGFATPQAGGDKPALALSEAYRNAAPWRRGNAAGARLERLGCDELAVTPPGGKRFEAAFDPATHLLARIRERRSFGAVVETTYADYQRRAGGLLATTVEMVTGGDPLSRETLRLEEVTLTAPRPARAYGIPTDQPADWSLPPSGRVTLPFRLLNNHVIVDVRVDGRGPFPFVVDTGGHDILTPATLAALHISPQGAAGAGGVGAETAINGFARVSRLDAGGATLRDQTVTTLDFSPRSVAGYQLGGMLGVEFLERFVVQIDYGADTVTLIDPRRFDGGSRRAAGTAIPFERYEHVPQVAGRFDGRPARFNIDTGSRLEVTLTTPFVRRERLKALYPAGVTVTDGWGVGGPSRSYVVRAQALALGPVAIRGPVASLSAAAGGAFSDPSYDGNIGGGLLKRFAVTFDYARRMIYLRPLAHPDPDVGRFDRAGLWLNLGSGGMEVMDVAAGGPAAEGGLERGDVITAIGGSDLTGRALSDVRRELKLLPTDRPVTIAYRRDGEARTSDIHPRDLIPGPDH